MLAIALEASRGSEVVSTIKEPDTRKEQSQLNKGLWLLMSMLKECYKSKCRINYGVRCHKKVLLQLHGRVPDDIVMFC